MLIAIMPKTESGKIVNNIYFNKNNNKVDIH